MVDKPCLTFVKSTSEILELWHDYLPETYDEAPYYCPLCGRRMKMIYQSKKKNGSEFPVPLYRCIQCSNFWERKSSE